MCFSHLHLHAYLFEFEFGFSEKKKKEMCNQRADYANNLKNKLCSKLANIYLWNWCKVIQFVIKRCLN